VYELIFKGHLPTFCRRTIARADILCFLATITYMGIIQCPAKRDYFPVDRANYLPIHPLIEIVKTTFQYLCHWFSTSNVEGHADDTKTLYGNDVDEEETVEKQTKLSTND
jgi:hypothetical protein